jgi:hypothetical protein
VTSIKHVCISSSISPSSLLGPDISLSSWFPVKPTYSLYSYHY